MSSLLDKPVRSTKSPALRTRDAARYVGLHYLTFLRYVRLGKIPCGHPPGSRIYRFHPDALDAWLKGQTR